MILPCHHCLQQTRDDSFVYLATVLDCCTKKVVGYAMADHMRTSLVCQAIDVAVRRCPIKKGATIFHSDRGSQCTSQKFLDHLKSYGIRPSVGRTGVCWDNAWAESFNATLKNENERVYRMVYPTKGKAMNDIASWIELRYESYSSSLSPRVSHSRRGRKRVPGPEEGSLKHKTSSVRKTPSSPIPCAPGVRARDVALVEDQIRLARPRASEVLGEGRAHVLRGLG